MNYNKFIYQIKQRIIGEKLFWLGFFALLCGSLCFLIYQQIYVGCCDSGQYLELAKIIRDKGIDQFSDKTRTFAYPWILAWILNASDLLQVKFIFLLYLVQLVIYFAVIMYSAKVSDGYSLGVGRWVYISGCANVFLMPYLSVTLTDAIYSSLCVFVVMLLIDLHRFRSNIWYTKYLTWIVFFTSFAITIRPAAIWLVPVALYGVAYSIIRSKSYIKNMVFLVFGMAPLLIQALININAFQVVSFLPVTDLGSLQMQWGIENIKYGTWLGGGAPQNFYSARGLIDVSGSNTGIFWYFNNIGDAIKLLLVKLFGAFDWDYVIPYPYFVPYFKWIPAFLSFSIFYFGVVAIVLNATKRAFTALGPRFLMLGIFLCWAAIALTSALELRFTLPMLCLLIYSATIAIIDIFFNRKHSAYKCVIFGWPVFVIVALCVSIQIRQSAVVIW